jgi:hypothetical protein
MLRIDVVRGEGATRLTLMKVIVREIEDEINE